MLKELFNTKKFVIFTTIFVLLLSVFCPFVSAKDISSKEQLKIVNAYQQKYFEIIKRNDVLLQTEDTDKLNADRKDLDDLFTSVERQITNKRYLNKYKKIQKRYLECDGITTIDINKCADMNYKAINKLLNNVYKNAESKLNFGDSKDLAYSELQWEKDVEDYKKVFDSMDFGTIGTSIYFGYEINMREFRTLLLMMYL